MFSIRNYVYQLNTEYYWENYRNFNKMEADLDLNWLIRIR